MKITLCGAAGEVTGSAYLVDTGKTRVLVDCGMFQGRGASLARNSRLAPIQPRRLDAVVLTHAHLDHTGRLPLLARGGFRCAIHTTAATIDLARLLLIDAAEIQAADVQRENRRRERRALPKIQPTYSRADVDALSPRFQTLDYNTKREIADGVSARLVDAGHMLGSASVELTIGQGESARTIAFSGDLGSSATPFLRDPTPLRDADLLFLESTYGDRDHRGLGQTLDEFAQILIDAHDAREFVLIPAFAIGRSQQILYHIAEFIRAGKIPKFPVYLDSPMAIEAIRIYDKHQDLFDVEAGRLARERQWRRDLSELQFCPTGEESRRLNNLPGPAVIIAGSGMCEGGRILHHLKHKLWHPSTHVVFVGYQSQGSLGARLLAGARSVTIHHERIAVAAKIHSLGGFSGHAGQTELLAWTSHLAHAKPRICLTHGEDPQREALRQRLAADLNLTAECPGPLAVIDCP